MKLIATNIGNLTDARFFAAYLPELLVLPSINNKEFAAQLSWLGEVQPWIEGPGWAIAPKEVLEESHLEALKPAGITTFVHSSVNSWVPKSEEFVHILQTSSYDVLRNIQVKKRYEAVIINDISSVKGIDFSAGDLSVYLTVSNLQEYRDIIDTCAGVTGIVLQGGAEEKVGLKSYDDLSDVLEAVFN